MKYIKGYENYNCTEPSAITIGKFDGVHRGHDLLISRVEKHQKEDQVVGVVFAFDMKQPGKEDSVCFFFFLNIKPH